jgi:hypothetical protein
VKWLTIAEEAKAGIADILAEVPSSFCGTLDYHIETPWLHNEKMEERTGISSRMIQDYRNKKRRQAHASECLLFV